MPKGDQSLVQPTFDQRVWSVVEQIPHGRLATYGQIADLIGAWGCARQVGWALRRLAIANGCSLASCGECQRANFDEPEP
jgi:alkylated DNA nucleotide flippase Atl1